MVIGFIETIHFLYVVHPSMTLFWGGREGGTLLRYILCDTTLSSTPNACVACFGVPLATACLA